MSLPDLGCACATVRRASRLVSRMYDRELRGEGLEATQFALLAAIHAQSGRTQAAIGAALGLEKATMSRNVRVMERKGWVSTGRGLKLTAEGRLAFEQGQAGWARAHAELQAKMGAENWEAMWRGLRAMSNVADEVVGS